MIKKCLKLILPVLILTMILSLFSVIAGASTYPSKDYWATEALDAAVKNKILYGKENGNLDPEANLTRAEMAAIIVRAFGANISTDISKFTDVGRNEWYYNDIAKAVHMGVFIGDANNTMRPDDSIIREEAFTVLARALVLSSSDYSPLSKFGDRDDISDWAKEYLSILAKKGYVNGNENGDATPKANITRAEFAQFMHNIFKTYFVTPGTYSSTGADSSMIRCESVNLSNITVPGDLVIGDGGNLSTIELTNVTIKGRLLVRGAATVKLKNTTVGENVVVKNINSNVHFDNYRDEKVFDGINIITSATFKEKAAGGGGGGGGGGPTPPTPGTEYVTVSTKHYKEDPNGTEEVDGKKYTLYSTTTANVVKGSTATPGSASITGYSIDALKGDYGKSVPNVTTDPQFKLYYNRNTYKVTLTYDGGTATPQPVTVTVTYDDTYKGLPTPTKTGFDFVGWFIGSDKIDENIKVEITNDVTAVAKWTPKTYKVFLDYNGGSVQPSVSSVDAVYTGQYQNLPQPTKAGYTFAGWYIDGAFNDETKKIKNGDSVATPDNINVVAKWTSNVYTLKFDLDGGTVKTGSTNDAQITEGGLYHSIPEVEKTDWNFAGWKIEYEDVYNGKQVSLGKENGAVVTAVAQWTKKDVWTVTFKNIDNNGGISTLPVIDGKIVGKPTYTIDGYTITNWTLNGTSYDFSVAVTGNIELVAQWEANKYNVVYYLEYGSNISEIIVYTYNSNEKIKDASEITGFDKPHYTFEGWTDVENSSTVKYKKDNATPVNLAKDKGATVILYGIWKPMLYTISYNGNNCDSNSPITDISTHIYDKSGYLQENKFVKTGWSFKEWNTQSDGKGVAYKSGEEVIHISSDMTLYAIWRANKYYVHYDGNGSDKGSMQPSEFVYDIEAALTSNLYERTGYSFAGWNTDSNGKGDSFTNNHVVKNLVTEGSITLYAQWSPNKYTLYIDYNDGTGSTSSIEVTYDKTYEDLPTPTRTGYTFGGWYIDGQKVEPTDKVQITSNDKVATAEWNVKTYTLVFEYLGGTADPQPTSMEITFGEKYKDIPQPQKAGYYFKGWLAGKYVIANDVLVDIDEEDKSTITATAQWSEIPVYKVTYYVDSSVYAERNVEENKTAENLTPTKTGYNFEGWLYNGVSYDFTTPVTAPLSLYADLRAIKSILTFNPGEGNVLVSSMEVTYDEAYENLPTPTRTGYKFTGWMVNGSKIENGKKVTIVENSTAVASWEPISYTIYLTPGEGSGQIVEKTIKYDENYQLYIPSDFAKTGWHITGWKDTLNNTTYKVNEVVSKLTANDGDKVYLNACWERNVFTVEYKPDGGSGKMDSQDVTYGVSGQYAKSNEFTKKGYKFMGWLAPSGETVKPSDDISTLTDQHDVPVSLTAIWEAKRYTVTYYPMNNGGSEVSVEYKWDDKNAGLKTPEELGFAKQGYTFNDWSIEEKNLVPPNKKAPLNLTDDEDTPFYIYAHWTPNNYVIRYLPQEPPKGTTEGEAQKEGYTSSHTVDDGSNLKVNQYDKTGYTFLGWQEWKPDATTFSLRAVMPLLAPDVDYEEGAKTNFTDVEEGDTIFLVPVWAPNTYSVKYYKNDGTDTYYHNEDDIFVYDGEQLLNDNLYTRKGYIFKGWSKDKTSPTPTIENIAPLNLATGEDEKNKVAEIYAVWEKITYTIKFAKGEADSGNAMADVTFVYDDGKVILPSVSYGKTGYNFDGWKIGNKKFADNATILTNDLIGYAVEDGNGNYIITLTAQFVPKMYLLVYRANDGRTYTEQEDNTNAVWFAYTDVNRVIDNNNFTYEGHDFTYWTLTPDGKGDQYKVGQLYNGIDMAKYAVMDSKGTERVYLYANWVIQKFDVEFNTNGGSSIDKQPIDYGNKVSRPLQNPTKTGYDFAGWFKDSEFKTEFDFDKEVIKTAGVIIYANWTPKKLVLTLDPDGGAFDVNNLPDNYTYDALTGKVSLTVTVGEKYPTLPEPTKDLKYFNGWYENTDNPNTEIKADKIVPARDENIEAKAKWGDKPSYNVKVVDYYGKGTEENFTVVQDENLSSTLEALTVTGYIHGGWYTDEKCTIIFDVTAPIKKDTTIYTNWTPKIYTIKYVGDGGKTSEGKEYYNQTFVYSKTLKVTLKHNQFIKKGYSFEGWATVKGDIFDGGVTLDVDVLLARITDEETNTIEFTAYWEEIEYQIIYQGNGGTDLMGEDEYSQRFIYNDKAVTLMDNRFTKEFYEFAGWSIKFSNDSVSTDELIDLANSDNKIVIKALWIPTEYTIVYNGNGGLTDNNEISYTQNFTYEDGKVVLDSNKFEKEYYEFKSWEVSYYSMSLNYDNGEELKPIDLIDFADIENKIILKATWTPKTYQIVYEGNGGQIDQGKNSYTQEFTYSENGTVTLDLNKFEKEGYKFTGWENDAVSYSDGELHIPVTELIALANSEDKIILNAKWEIKTFIVKFDYGYASKTLEIEVPYKGTVRNSATSEELDLILKPTRIEYNFGGWYMETGYVNTFSIDEEITTGNTVYAQWNIKTFPVTFNPDNGNKAWTETVNYGANVTKPSVNPTKEGYDFLYWMDENEVEYNFANSITAEVNLTANWKIKTYEVKFVDKNNNDIYSSVFVEHGSKVTKPQDPVLNYHTFGGWYKDAGYNQEFDFNSVEIEDTTTIYAKFEPIVYKVVYHANNGTADSVESEEFTYNSVVKIANNEFGYEGYTFENWILRDNENISYKAGDSLAGTALISNADEYNNIHLNAKWNINKYTVTFVLDNGEENITQTVNHGSKVIKPENPSKTGYTFDNWYLEDGKVYNFDTLVTKKITLTARWIINTYYVSFNTNGGSTIYDVPVNYNETIGSKMPADPTKEGYSFGGWYKDEDLLVPFNKDTEKITEDITIYAKWIQNKLKVTFNSDGGTSIDPQEVNYGGKVTRPNDPIKEGFVFDNWYLGNKVYDFTATVTENITLIAKWIKLHTVRFNPANGNMAWTEIVKDGETITAPTQPVKYGYNFDGWVLKDGSMYNFNTAVKGDITLNATWTAKKYTVIYNGNGNTDGSMSGSNFTWDKEYSLTANAYTKTGYKFIGWATDSTVKYDKYYELEYGVTRFDDKHSNIKNLTAPDGTITLYAIWSPISYKVEYHSNNGSNLTYSTDAYINYDAQIQLWDNAINYFVKAGYEFNGWNTKADGSGISYSASQTVTNLSSEDDKTVKLYAQWKAKEYTVTFNAGGGSVDAQPIKVTYTSTYPELPTPTHTNTSLNFAGWYINGILIKEGNVVGDEVISDTSVEAIAVWSEKIVHNVVFHDYYGKDKNYTTTIYDGDLLNEPTLPTQEGYTFAGWYEDENYTTAYVFGNKVTGTESQTVEVYVKWNIGKYEVVFVAANSNPFRQTFFNVEYGAYIYPNRYDDVDFITPQPEDNIGNQFLTQPDPKADINGTRVFKGWILNGEELPTDEDYKVLVTGAMRFDAKIEHKTSQGGRVVTVTFDTDGGTEITAVEVEVESKVERPYPDPEKAGYVFEGWYTNKSFNEEFDFEATIIEDITIYAKWAKASNTVTFISAGEEYAKVEVPYNEVIGNNMPTDPVMSGFEFKGWYTDEQFNNMFDETIKITENITLYAFWETKVSSGSYTVTFIVDGQIVSEETYNIGDMFMQYMPISPSKPGFVFDGWNTAEDGTGTTYKGEELVESDLTVYAKWIKVHTVTFNSNEGSAVTSQTVKDNEKATKPSDPVKEGFVFAGWYTDEECTNEFGFETEVTSDITLYAKWVSEEETFEVTFYPINSSTNTTVEVLNVVAGNSVPENTLEDKKWEAFKGRDPDQYDWVGYIKDSSVSSAYTENYQHEVEYDWWYQTADGWKPFDDTVKITEDTNVYLRAKKIVLFIDALDLSGEEMQFEVWYDEETRLIDSVKNLLHTQDSKRRNSPDVNEHLNIINTGLSIIEIDDTLKQKLIDFNIIDEDGNILNHEFMLKYVQVLGKDNVEKFIVDSAKESFKLGNNEHLNKGISDFIANDKEGVIKILSRTDVTKAAKEYIINIAEEKYADDYFMNEIGLAGVPKDMFIDAIRNNTDNAYVKVIEYFVEHREIKEEYAEKVVEYISRCPLLKDDIVDGIIESTYQKELDTLVKEIKNNEQFTVTDKTIFVAEALKNKLEKDYGYDKVIGKIPESIQSKLFRIYPEAKAREIYESAFNNLTQQIKGAIDLLENGEETVLIDCGLTFKINPVEDIYAPLYRTLVTELEESIVGEKLYYGMDDESNKYLVETVKLFDKDNLFDLSTGNDDSGYKLKSFDDYYNLILKLTILGDDTLTWYKEKLPQEKADQVLLNYENLVLKYANTLAEFLDGYANGTKDPDNKYFDKVEGIIKGKFPELFDKLVNWYKDSPVNKKYESDDYALFRKGVKETYETYDSKTDELYDHKYIDNVLQKLDRIKVGDNVSYTDYKGVTHTGADIYEITVKGIKGTFVVVNKDMYEVRLQNYVIVIERTIAGN